MKHPPTEIPRIDDRNAVDSRLRYAVDTNRGTGRTSRMLEALPVENTPTVVVHTQALCDYVRNLAHHLRPDLRHPIRVRIVRDMRDCDYLRGLTFVVDHATLDYVRPEVRHMLAALDKLRRVR